MTLQSEREKIKLDLERQFAQRQFVLESVEAKNKQDAVHNEIERVHLSTMKTEYQGEQMRMSQLDLELQKAQGELVCLRQENELLKEKLGRCLDYDFVVQENRMLKHKLDISKELIGERIVTGRMPLATGRLSQRKRSVTFDNGQDVSGPAIPLLDLNGRDQFHISLLIISLLYR
jgi:hypothetical protein